MALPATAEYLVLSHDGTRLGMAVSSDANQYMAVVRLGDASSTALPTLAGAGGHGQRPHVVAGRTSVSPTSPTTGRAITSSWARATARRSPDGDRSDRPQLWALVARLVA